MTEEKINISAVLKKGEFHDSGVPWYYEWAVKYIHPFSIIIAIICNAISLIVIAQTSVKINSRLRYLYICYLVWDFGLIFFKDLQDGYLADGLYWATNGKFFIAFELISSAACKFFRGGRFSTEVLSAYTITFMNIERYVQQIISKFFLI